MENEKKEPTKEGRTTPKVETKEITVNGQKFKVHSMTGGSPQDFANFINQTPVGELIRKQVDWERSPAGEVARLHKLLEKARRTRLWR